MAYTYEQLKNMTVAELRQVAQQLGPDAPEGYSTMHKEKLLPALCNALDIRADHAAHGEGKTQIKQTIRRLKARRDDPATPPEQRTQARHQIHGLKHKLRRMAQA